MEELNYEKYLKFKEISSTKTYYNKFKDLEKGLSLSTFAFNGLSIFLAFFFFTNIISKAFTIDQGNYWISGFVVILLILFEGLKRKVFDVFSVEVVKAKGQIFKKHMIMFLLATTMIITGSFYFSMNGAGELMNKDVIIEQIYNTDLEKNSIEISSEYDIEIKQLRSENNLHIGSLETINKNIAELVNKGWSTGKYQDDKTNVLELIKKNKAEISKIKSEKTDKINKLKLDLDEDLSTKKESNESNIYIFLILSAIIEIIILSGIFFGVYFKDRCSIEYFNHIVKSPDFQNWKVYNDIADIIFNAADTKVGEAVISTKLLLEIIELEEYNVTKKQVDNCFKIFSYLNITKTEGNRRILKKSNDEIREILKTHYKIT